MDGDMQLGKTKIRPNGEPGILEIEWSPLIRWGAGVLAAILASAVVGNVAMYREIGAVAEAVRSMRAEMEYRIREGREEHRGFVSRHEFENHNHGGTAGRERP